MNISTHCVHVLGRAASLVERWPHCSMCECSSTENELPHCPPSSESPVEGRENGREEEGRRVQEGGGEGERKEVRKEEIEILII